MVEVEDIVDSLPSCVLSDVYVNQVQADIKGKAEPWTITGQLSASLLAERSGNTGDRVYGLGVNCSDFSGNAAIGIAEVIVPHDRRKR